jgi:hypothetical protein
MSVKYTRNQIIQLNRNIDDKGGRYRIIKILQGTTPNGELLIAIQNTSTRKYRNIIESQIQKPNKFKQMKTELLKKIMKTNREAKLEYMYRVKNKML